MRGGMWGLREHHVETRVSLEAFCRHTTAAGRCVSAMENKSDETPEEPDPGAKERDTGTSLLSRFR